MSVCTRLLRFISVLLFLNVVLFSATSFSVTDDLDSYSSLGFSAQIQFNSQQPSEDSREGDEDDEAGGANDDREKYLVCANIMKDHSIRNPYLPFGHGFNYKSPHLKQELRPPRV